MFRKSLVRKIILIFFLFACMTFVAYMVINSFFLKPYYTKTKEKILFKGYKEINEIVNSSSSSAISSDDYNEIAKICETNGLTLIIVNTSNEVQFEYGNGFVLKERLININFDRDDSRILEKTDDYVVRSYTDKGFMGKDSGTGSEFIEINGYFNDNNIFLMRMALESIDESVRISRNFFFVIGLIIVLIEVVVAYFVGKSITNPIIEVSNVSKEIANLNFSAKSNVKTVDETKVLSDNLNLLSERLEKTINELTDANKKLKKDIEIKEQVDEMRKEFISNVSHELKTPIALIQGYAEGLRDCVADDTESREFYCDVIVDEAVKMNKMVKNLLSLNQLEYGENVIEKEEFSLNQVISGVVKRLDYLTTQKEVNVELKINKEYTVNADEFKIEEVITNYLTNALNHVDEKKIVKIETEERPENKLRVYVYNSGNHISEDDLENIWIKFYKVDKARTRAYGGSGIGLSIVKAIVKAHKNECGVENVSEGVRFWFDIDLV